MESTESILTSIKKLLGIEETYDQFDPDLIMDINAVFMILNQLGIGPADCFSISDKTSNWVDFLGTDLTKLPVVKPYISTKVRLMFDPPTSSAVIDEMNKLINEYEWRLTITVLPTPLSVTVKESEDYDGE